MSSIPAPPQQEPDESTLTERQRKVLDAIRLHIDEQGFAPSFREIGEAQKPFLSQTSTASAGGQGLYSHERQ